MQCTEIIDIVAFINMERGKIQDRWVPFSGSFDKTSHDDLLLHIFTFLIKRLMQCGSLGRETIVSYAKIGDHRLPQPSLKWFHYLSHPQNHQVCLSCFHPLTCWHCSSTSIITVTQMQLIPGISSLAYLNAFSFHVLLTE